MDEKEKDEIERAGLLASGLIPTMAVMKTCCGCLSTKSGTMSILLIYSILYITGVVVMSWQVSNKQLQTFVDDQLQGQYDCTAGADKDMWWCKGVEKIKTGIRASLICGIVILLGFLVCSVLAIFGTSKGKHWFMLPWIILEFLFLTLILVFLILVIVIITMYGADKDTSTAVASGVLFAAAMAFLFYLWLCVVSHFQILREISKLGLNGMENVQQFKNEDDEDDGTLQHQMDRDDMGEEEEAEAETAEDEYKEHPTSMEYSPQHRQPTSMEYSPPHKRPASSSSLDAKAKEVAPIIDDMEHHT